jgi:hypothetical protein
VAVSGSFYAAEKLLDTAFMQTLHARLGDLIAASAPRRGLLLATTADDARHLAALATLTEHEARGPQRIGEAVVLVQGGRSSGSRGPPTRRRRRFIAGAREEAELLRRLFGRNEPI